MVQHLLKTSRFTTSAATLLAASLIFVGFSACKSQNTEQVKEKIKNETPSVSPCDGEDNELGICTPHFDDAEDDANKADDAEDDANKADDAEDDANKADDTNKENS